MPLNLEVLRPPSVWHFPLHRLENIKNEKIINEGGVIRTEIRDVNPCVCYVDKRVEKFKDIFEKIYSKMTEYWKEKLDMWDYFFNKVLRVLNITYIPYKAQKAEEERLKKLEEEEKKRLEDEAERERIKAEEEEKKAAENAKKEEERKRKEEEKLRKEEEKKKKAEEEKKRQEEEIQKRIKAEEDKNNAGDEKVEEKKQSRKKSALRNSSAKGGRMTSGKSKESIVAKNTQPETVNNANLGK